MALLLGAVQAFAMRFEMNADGVQYLDNADAYRTGDFKHAINSQWSPLYPWLLGALFNAVHPSRFGEFPLVHWLNFGVFAASLAAFLFFMKSLRDLLPRQSASAKTCLALVCYSAFLYCSLDLTSTRNVAPDLLVNLFAFLAAGLLVRMAAGAASQLHYVALGLTLGIGYLAKAPFLVYGLLCLGMAAAISRQYARPLRRMAIALAMWIAIATPYVWLLSSAKGRFTVGDSGKFNVIWMVNGVPYRHWRGGPAENGRPIHPTRQLSSNPAIFEFAAPVGGTYPPWYDPIYWNDGAKIAWRAADFGRAIVTQARLYVFLVHHRQTPLLFALLVLLLLSAGARQVLSAFTAVWPALLLGAAPFAMYAAVHAEGRYLAPFFVLLWCVLFFGALRNAPEAHSRVLVTIGAVAAFLMLFETIAVSFPSAPISYVQDAQAPASGRVDYEIARNLEALGLKPGDPVAIIGSDHSYAWARLAGARIIMEISLDPASAAGEWSKSIEILTAHGARFVVAPTIPGVVNQPGWTPLGNTGTFAYPVASLR